MQKTIKKIFIPLIVIMLFLPMAQQHFRIFKIKPLNGYYAKEDKPDTLSFKSWFSESYQKKYTKYLEDTLGFREVLIRTNNQINYSLFKKTDATNVVIGKHNCLYEEGYILDYTGAAFLGTKFWNELLRRTKLVQDTLKKINNTDLIIVLEAGKASFYPEYIPERYHAENRTLSNMEYIARQTKKMNINILNLNTWFCAMKDTSRYPLYATYGVHWSTFGMYKAADTLSRFIEHLRNIDMPEMIWKSYTVTDKLKDVDFDIEATLNLLCELPHMKMCYPEIAYNTKPDKVKPKLLTIGDSYYWGFINNHIVDSMYSNHQYWYYFRGIWPDIWNSRDIPRELNLQQEVEKQDVILVAMTEMNAFYGFWGFIDELYKIYFPGKTNEEYEAMKLIMKNDLYFFRHRALAKKYRKSVEEIIAIEIKNRDICHLK
jgi:hypothetical protein